MNRVLITGAASGLGASMAKYYASKGYSVCIADIQIPEGEKLASELANTYSSDCFFSYLDVTSEKNWETLVNNIGKRWKGLDVLINNAGVATSGSIDMLPIDDFRWTIDINLMGVVKGCHYFTPYLKKSRGTLINVASIAGLLHMPTMAAYNVSKAGVVALSETLCGELDPYGVNVSVVCPAFFQTNLLKTMRSSNESGEKVASKRMASSKINADDIAAMVFKGSKSEKFMILTHKKENNLWRIKRYFPSFYLNQIKKIGLASLKKSKNNQSINEQTNSQEAVK